MDSCELASFVTAVACSVSKCFSREELEILAAVFNQLGETLETIITNDGINERKSSGGICENS